MSKKIVTSELMNRAFRKGIAIPAFNIPYLPMMKPVVDALRDTGVMGLIMVARLDLEHIGTIAGKAGVPLVLHGGTGISPEDVRNAIKQGIAKINIATAIRQPWEKNLSRGYSAASRAVYDAVTGVLVNDLKLEGSASTLLEEN